MSTDGGRDIVTRVAWRAFRVPFRHEFRAAHGSMTYREGFVVEANSASGIRGIGEAAPLPSFAGGSVEETGAALEAFARLCVGHRPGDRWDELRDGPQASHGSLAAARCGLETALADLASRHARMPLGEWLSSAGSVEINPAAAVPVNTVIDMDTVAEVGDAVRAAVAAGFQAVKIKVGGDPVGDAARVAAAREAGGRELEIRADANRSWSEPDALEFFAAVQPFGLALCEEPLAVAPGHFRALARVRSHTTVPIAVDESCQSSEQLQRAIFEGATAWVVVKPMVTGLAEALGMLRMAADHDLRVVVTTTFDTGVATALSAHVASLISPPIPACGLATLDHLDHPLVADPPRFERGQMIVPRGDGLGVELDDDAVDRYAVGPAIEVTA